jgi:sugar phosphate isomerase/epimerase
MLRRTFLAAAALQPAPVDWKKRLGVMCQLGHEEAGARKVLDAAREAGYQHIQINFAWDRVSPAFIEALPEWVRAAELWCVALGVYVNCADPANVIMNTRAVDFHRSIGLAGHLRCRRLVAWTGGYGRGLMQPDPRNFEPAAADAVLRFLRSQMRVIAAEQIEIALETYITLICPDAPSLRGLLDQCPRQIGAVLDPPNLTPESRYAERDQALTEMFETLRGRISVVHLKDFRLRSGGGYDLPGPRQGTMNYQLFGRLLSTLPADIPIIAEHIEPAQFAETRRRLLDL